MNSMIDTKWKQQYGGIQLLDVSNRVLAEISVMRVSLKVSVLGQEKTIVFGGPLTFMSDRYAKFKRKRAIKKAKKWVKKIICDSPHNIDNY